MEQIGGSHRLLDEEGEQDGSLRDTDNIHEQ